MENHEKVLDAIFRMTDPKQLRNTIKNAKAKGVQIVADAAFKRLVSIQPKEAPGTVEHDFWQTVVAFEEVLTEERGRTTRLARTRQKIARVGERQTLIDFALESSPTDGFKMLAERNMLELTGEAIIVKHADQFEANVVAAAQRRLAAVTG